jgi:phosphate acetyltransferase
VLERIVAAWQPISERSDVVIVEGLRPLPGNLYGGELNQALAKALDADVLLVARWSAAEVKSGEGPAVGEAAPGKDAVADTVEGLAESLAVTASGYWSGEQPRVVGCLVNGLPANDPSAATPLSEALAERGLHLIGAVLHRPELAWLRVHDLVGELGPRVFNEGDSSRRIKDVAVFAQGVPGGLRMLTNGRLVVVPGDRHEVVMAVCLAALNGTRLAALVLSAGVEPDPRVWELARAGARPDCRFSSPRRTAMRPRRWCGALTRTSVACVVLPEGTEPRTLQAAVVCAERGIARSVLLGSPDEVARVARSLGLQLPDGVTVIDGRAVAERYLTPLIKLRQHRGWSEQIARDSLSDPIMVATMMLAQGEVDGLIAGALHTTAATVRPALQILGTKPGSRLVSSVFFMLLPDEVVVYGDCAVNPRPDAEQLAEIAIQSAASSRAFGIEPRVAMISFSTGTSGTGNDVDKVAEATRIVHEREPELPVDGPLQYDAAAVVSVAQSKRPGSAVAGRANVFIFPDLDTGNTTYKAVQRNAHVLSVGPMLQGLAKPVNDLSRGASVDDIVYTVALTAIQSLAG